MQVTSEMLRHAMRHWTTGVSIVTSSLDGHIQGMTVNSFNSISLDPPMVAVTLATGTRTQKMVDGSGVFGVTILGEGQADLSDRFAGRTPENDNRFSGLNTFSLVTGAPLFETGLVGLDCRVVHSFPTNNAVLYIAEVLAIRPISDGKPLVYHNRLYHSLGG